MKKDWIYYRGDIYMADLDPLIGAEQGGKRPVVVLQNDVGNNHSPTLIVAPITSAIKKTYLPTHHVIISATGLDPIASMIELEQLKTIDKSRILYYIGKVSKEDLDGIDKALGESLGLNFNDKDD